MKTITRQAIEKVLKDPSVHEWIKDTIQTMLQKNPIDAFYGAQLILAIARALKGDQE